ncbi:BA14K family protein [Rhizobium sp. S152]|uniref:BA14K family protein n=1 Tax=Rhizobium sp. S152 TaxID=3055038 RepID=UPI003FA76636
MVWHLGNVMKAIASLAFGLACAVGASLGVASVTSVFQGSEGSSSMTTGASDLWTSTPVKIDRAAQTFERMPAVLSRYASSPLRTTGSPLAAEQNVATSLSPAANERPLPTEHFNWCASRYHSFHPATNSYRAFSGEVRRCSSPFETSSSVSLYSEDQVAQSKPVTERVATWCASRYRSYRAEDNTYQPYGGQRRICHGPTVGDETALR